jgi:hypothetical protein
MNRKKIMNPGWLNMKKHLENDEKNLKRKQVNKLN